MCRYQNTLNVHRNINGKKEYNILYYLKRVSDSLESRNVQ